MPHFAEGLISDPPFLGDSGVRSREVRVRARRAHSRRRMLASGASRAHVRRRARRSDAAHAGQLGAGRESAAQYGELLDGAHLALRRRPLAALRAPVCERALPAPAPVRRGAVARRGPPARAGSPVPQTVRVRVACARTARAAARARAVHPLQLLSCARFQRTTACEIAPCAARARCFPHRSIFDPRTSGHIRTSGTAGSLIMIVYYLISLCAMGYFYRLAAYCQ